LTNIITEKEKLQSELENALNQIDRLKTLIAENTLQSLYTVQPYHKHTDENDENDEPIDINKVNDVVVGAYENHHQKHSMNRSAVTDMNIISSQ